jgi:hypothetical protein
MTSGASADVLQRRCAASRGRRCEPAANTVSRAAEVRKLAAAGAPARSGSCSNSNPRNVSLGSERLETVLAGLLPRRFVPLGLTHEQKRALPGRDGQAALHALRHLLGGRAVAAQGKLRTRFPLTEGMFCTVARKLGRSVGQSARGG